MTGKAMNYLVRISITRGPAALTADDLLSDIGRGGYELTSPLPLRLPTSLDARRESGRALCYPTLSRAVALVVHICALSLILPGKVCGATV